MKNTAIIKNMKDPFFLALWAGGFRHAQAERSLATIARKSGQGLLYLFVSTLSICCSYNPVQARVIAGSPTSTIQVSSGGVVRNSDMTIPIDMDGGTFFMGDEAIYTTKALRAGGASRPPPAVKNTKLTTKEGTGVIPGNLRTITTTRTSEVATIQAQPVSGNINTFVDLNGQTSTLAAALSFVVGVYPYNGTIDLNNQALTINGPVTIASDSDVLFLDANNMNFTNNINLDTNWVFDGDGVLTGNGGVLDLSGGGVLKVRPFTSVGLHNFVLRGVENGRIVLYDDTSELRLSNMVLELSDNYTVTTGGLYVNGPTTIVTADKVLTLSQRGSMTVDHVSLLYDTLSYPDQQNITPALGADANNKHTISLNSGVIRQINAPTQGLVHIMQDTAFDAITVVHPNRKIIFDQSAVVDGGTFPIIFSNASEPLITVSADQNAVIHNAVLEYFSPSYLNIGSGASLTFGDKTAMTFASDQDLSMTMTFVGQCRINGNNHTLNLGAHGGLMVSGTGSALQLENMVITGLQGTKINCTDGTCTFSLNNVRFVLDGSYEFPTDRVEVLQ